MAWRPGGLAAALPTRPWKSHFPSPSTSVPGQGPSPPQPALPMVAWIPSPPPAGSQGRGRMDEPHYGPRATGRQ